MKLRNLKCISEISKYFYKNCFKNLHLLGLSNQKSKKNLLNVKSFLIFFIMSLHNFSLVSLTKMKCQKFSFIFLPFLEYFATIFFYLLLLYSFAFKVSFHFKNMRRLKNFITTTTTTTNDLEKL